MKCAGAATAVGARAGAGAATAIGARAGAATAVSARAAGAGYLNWRSGRSHYD